MDVRAFGSRTRKKNCLSSRNRLPFMTLSSQLQETGFSCKKCIFLQTRTFSYTIIHFLAKECLFLQKNSAAEKRGLWEGVVQEPLRRALFCVFLCSEVIFSCKSHRNFFQKLPLQCRHFLENPLAKNPKRGAEKCTFLQNKCTFVQKNTVFGWAHGRKLQEGLGSRVKNATQLALYFLRLRAMG